MPTRKQIIAGALACLALLCIAHPASVQDAPPAKGRVLKTHQLGQCDLLG